MAHRDIELTTPIRTKVESSCHNWLRHVLPIFATLRSISPRSFANLLIMRPDGLVWKNTIGARSIECSMVSWIPLAAFRLEIINQKEFASVTITCRKWIQNEPPLIHIHGLESYTILLWRNIMTFRKSPVPLTSFSTVKLKY